VLVAPENVQRQIYDTAGRENIVDIVERRSKLVTLVYRVLALVVTPPEGASDGETLAILADAFQLNASQEMEREREKKVRRTTDRDPLPESLMAAHSFLAPRPLTSQQQHIAHRII
jgi:hypothetical protein